MTKVFLKKKISTRIALGHPWVFANEVGEIVGEITDGEIVAVYSSNGSFVGQGYYNSASQIKIRLLSRKQETIDEKFFFNKIKAAWEFRKKIGNSENCRLIYSESDELPGLIIDKLNDHFVLQTLTLGMELWKPAIVKALEEIFQPKGIYERNDISTRKLEGLPEVKGFISQPFDTLVQINELDAKLMVDLKEGKLTGYFLGRKHIRAALKNIAKNAEVLDTFCFTGSMGIHAAVYGAKSVLGIDNIEENIVIARKNAELNNLSEVCKFENANAFDVLKLFTKEDRHFDVIIIDPPAMVNNKEQEAKALAALKELNLRALKLLRPGGFLVTCNSSYQVTTSQFTDLIQDAAKDAKKKVRQIANIGQTEDFPIVWNVPSSKYLKCIIVEVID